MRLSRILMLALLAGCAAQGGGSRIDAGPAAERKMAEDAAARLAALYPPAATRFTVRRAAGDTFGASLATALRARGYALQEVAPSAGAVKTGAAGRSDTRQLSYVVDQPAGTDWYRLTLSVDEQHLSRAYLRKDGSVAAAGYWVRQE